MSEPKGHVADQERDESLAEQRSLLGSVEGILYRRDLVSGQPLAFYGQVAALTGYDAADFSGSRVAWEDLAHPSDRGMLEEDAERQRSVDGYVVDREYRIRDRMGRERWVHETGRVVADDSGARRWRQGMIVDVTERHHAEEALRASEQRYRQLFELGSDAVFLVDDETGQILEANSAAETMYGYSRLELLARRNVDLSAEPEATRAAGRSPALTIPLRWHRRKDGTVFPIEITAQRFERHGRGVHLVAVRDIAFRLDAERHLRESERRFRTFFEAAPEYCLILSPEGAIRDVNAATCHAVGATREALVGTHLAELYDSSCRDRVRAMAEEWHHDRPVEDVELKLTSREGEARTVLLSASMVRDESGAPDYVMVIQRDLTAYRKAEENLRQAQKLDALGRLAGSVAHEFNNALGVMTGHAEMGLELIPPGHPLGERLQRILDGARQAGSVTRQLQTFAHRSDAGTQSLDLNQVVRDLHSLLQRLAGDERRLQEELHADVGAVRANRAQLEQVLLNLVINAAEAIPPGGRIVLRTEPEGPAAGVAPLHRRFVLTVSDDGVGMDAAVVDRIFEPFFRGHERPGRGTGLGLSVVYGLVRQWGGSIDVESAPGKGTYVRVVFPEADVPPAPTVLDASSGVVVPRGHGTVLLVEDEEALRHVTAEVLESLGFDVITAADGASAIHLATQESRRLDVLVTDVIMPGVRGDEVAAELARLQPHLRVLFVSGYPGDVVGRQPGLDLERHAFLAKPFSVARLAEAIRRVLDGPPFAAS